MKCRNGYKTARISRNEAGRGLRLVKYIVQETSKLARHFQTLSTHIYVYIYIHVRTFKELGTPIGWTPSVSDGDNPMAGCYALMS